MLMKILKTVQATTTHTRRNSEISTGDGRAYVKRSKLRHVAGTLCCNKVENERSEGASDTRNLNGALRVVCDCVPLSGTIAWGEIGAHEQGMQRPLSHPTRWTGTPCVYTLQPTAAFINSTSPNGDILWFMRPGLKAHHFTDLVRRAASVDDALVCKGR